MKISNVEIVRCNIIDKKNCSWIFVECFYNRSKWLLSCLLSSNITKNQYTLIIIFFCLKMHNILCFHTVSHICRVIFCLLDGSASSLMSISLLSNSKPIVWLYYKLMASFESEMNRRKIVDFPTSICKTVH